MQDENTHLESGRIDPVLDQRLERLLRADAASTGYLEDGGFTARVMAALPPVREQRSYSWLGPALGAGAAACFAAMMPVVAPLESAFSGLARGQWMASEGLMVLAPLILLAYAAAWFAATESN